MIRIREITDPDLRVRVREKLAQWRGCQAAAIPDWFELDDADYVDLLMAIEHDDDLDVLDDWRM